MPGKYKLGTLVISLDFELYWGVRDRLSLADYKNRLQGTEQAILQILDLFRQNNIAATWATVGFLHYQNTSQLQANLPSQLPTYTESELSPYPYIEKEARQIDGRFHFGSELIDQIAECPQQEIATHTFSHYYCLETGQNQFQFQADLEAAIRLAASRDFATNSLVFPRNQYNQDYLEILRKLRITSYRGNQQSPMYNSIKGDGDKASKRILRLLDNYLNLSGHNCYSLEEIAKEYPFNIAASRFLRPYSDKLKYFDRFRLRRITSELDYAASKGYVYHLWWHPHNFGENLAENIEFLTKILQHYQVLASQGKMRSLNMQQLAEICLEKNPQTDFVMGY